jgi:hypothetical protein
MSYWWLFWPLPRNRMLNSPTRLIGAAPATMAANILRPRRDVGCAAAAVAVAVQPDTIGIRVAELNDLRDAASTHSSMSLCELPPRKCTSGCITR